ncbi:MAG: L,D-transpeptidase family protein [Oscillospiraceae bacterium]|nr:L,D-transpeptidase family protein [Oscillospiraceae bacterium]
MKTRMKKLLVFLLAAALLMSCCGCAFLDRLFGKAETQPEVTAEVFPAGVSICGTDVSGLTAEEAQTTVEENVKSYVLTLSLDKDTLTFTAEDLSLSCQDVDFAEILSACLVDSEKKNIVAEDLLTYDTAKITEALQSLSGEATTPKNASIRYDEATKAFVLDKEEVGGGINTDVVLAAVKEAIPLLLSTVELDAETIYQPAEITADSEQAQKALKAANDMLAVTLTYTYSPEDAESATETINRDVILPWLVIQEDGLTVEIDSGLLQDYVTKMDEAHSVADSYSKFKTTGGSSIDIRVPAAGQTVDTDKLYNDIYECVTTGVSGDRDAPYAEKTDTSGNFGGNYVEVDLTSQHVWAYSGGTCVVSADIVSGCVNTGHCTPTGLYTIQSKETNRYLVGEGYKTWVNFWMPFNGGVGLHDADGWRWSYGGTIYYYSGSHGCVNMPYSAASAIYSAVSVGTHVVVYGGATSVTPVGQSISGTSSYTVTEGSASFSLDAAAAYGKPTLTYSSSDPSVLTVSGGTVTVKGVGTATITVTAPAVTGYTSATKTITVTVTGKCANGHTWGGGVVTTPATCTADGVMTYTCSVCGETKTEAIPATGHSWDSGVVTTAPTCVTPGVMTYTCNVCGETRTETIPATGQHNFVNGVCTICGAIDPNYQPPDTTPAP